MDFRRPLFELELYSPRLAKKIWNFVPFLGLGVLPRGHSIRVLTDIHVELSARENSLGPAARIADSFEYAISLLWLRHLKPLSEKFRLLSLDLKLLEHVEGEFILRADLSEVDRENMLRKIRNGMEATLDVAAHVVDKQERSLAQVTGTWKIFPSGPMLLGRRYT